MINVIKFEFYFIIIWNKLKVYAEYMKRMRRQTCRCNQLEQMQSWTGESCVCIPKSSTLSMSCSCPQVQQQLQQSNYCGCNLHDSIGQRCRTGCQQSCNMQCNPYMSQIYCDNACLEACMQSCSLQQQQQQQPGNLAYWNPTIYPMQQSYPSYPSHSYQQLLPFTEQCLTCLIACGQFCSTYQPFSDGNMLQCGCMQQCQQACLPSMHLQSSFSTTIQQQQQQQQQCIPYCQQNCQQFCNQQQLNNIIQPQRCQSQCKQQCSDICIMSPESQLFSPINSQLNPFISSNSYSYPSFNTYPIQSQYCLAKCFDNCKQSCGLQTTHCSNPCNQNCQQFCHPYQQPVPVVQQPKQMFQPQVQIFVTRFLVFHLRLK